MSCCCGNTPLPTPCVDDAAQELMTLLNLNPIISSLINSLPNLPKELKPSTQKSIDTTKALQTLLTAMAESNYCCEDSGGSSGAGRDGILDGGLRMIGIGLLDGGYRI